VSATLAATILLGLFGLLTVLNIRRRLNAARDGMVQISEDLDLSKNLPAGRQDEMAMPSRHLTISLSGWRNPQYGEECFCFGKYCGKRNFFRQ
jgi:hypothetical protein